MAIYNYKIKKGGMNVLDFISSFFLGKEKIKYYKNTKESVLINGNIAKLSDVLETNDVLTLQNEDKLDLKPLKKKINIIYEDDHYLIINKPINILVHSDGNQNVDNNLVNAVAYYYQNKGLDIPVMYCHRLDKDTSGLMIFAKDPLTESYIKALIESRELHREYLAIASGVIDKNIVINKGIGRDRHVNGKYRVSPDGKEAITLVDVYKKFKKYTAVLVNLKTGRTHQIRVHMSSIGHPLLGDTLYGGNLNLMKRQALHSYHVTFFDPHSEKNMEFFAKIPFDMAKLLELN
jgi:23S rRNA pseudouridine1911/1915/1917 synthase